MAKPVLPVNFQDDIMNAAMDGKRRYRIINNADGTISLEDVTVYDQVGSNFGAAQINQTNAAVNAAANGEKIIDDMDTIMAVTEGGYIAGALALKDLSAKSPFSFGIDSDGNYGYIKEGADTVTPFKSLFGVKYWNSGNIILSAQQSRSATFSKPAGVTEIIIIYMVSSPYSGPTISYTKNCINNEKTILGWSQGQSSYYGASTHVIVAQTIYDAGNITFTIRSVVPSGNALQSSCGIAVLY